MYTKKDTVMNCNKHLNDYAVATCASCGVGLCQNCLNSSVYSYDSKPLCHDCNLKAAEDEMSTLSRRKVWALIKCIFVLVFMILGFSIWQSTGDAMRSRHTSIRFLCIFMFIDLFGANIRIICEIWSKRGKYYSHTEE